MRHVFTCESNCLGCVHDLITTEQQYYLAIEVTAETRLFYHVVSDDKVAMDILKQINKRDLPGEVNFFPLNRLAAKQHRDVADQVLNSLLYSNFII